MSSSAEDRLAARPLRVRLTRPDGAPARFCLYGLLAMAGEILFYNVVKLGRQVPVLSLAFQFDWRVDPRLGLDDVWSAPGIALFGQSSLWMFLVYGGGIMVVVEPVYRRFCRQPVWGRALLYGAGILIYEGVAGWLLYGITGYRIWYYDDALAVGGMTSLYTLPTWMVAGLVAEFAYRQLMDEQTVRQLEAADAPAEAPGIEERAEDSKISLAQ